MRCFSTPVALTLLAIFCAHSSSKAQPINPGPVNALVEEALKAWQVPGAAVAIVSTDKILYLRGFGVRELGKKDPVTPHTIFPLGSCSKAFTTAGMAMLVDEGKMGWDDPVRKHVEFFRLADPLADTNVTLRDLTTHRTGVNSHDLLWYRAPWGPEDMVRRMGRIQPNRSFRSAFQYQSVMFTAAGLAVASASGGTWNDFVQKRIFDPLDMTASGCTTTRALQATDRSGAHRRNRNGEVEAIPWYTFAVPNAAGSIHASANDLTHWLQLHLGKGSWRGRQLVSAASLGETHSPQFALRVEGAARAMHPDTLQMSYGMAWLIQDYRGQLVISHAGLIDGFRAQLTFLPDAGLGLVILSNLEGTRMNLALNNTLMDHLLRLPARDWNSFYEGAVKAEEAATAALHRARQAKRHSGTRPSRDLQAYAGTYHEPAYGEAQVLLENGSLVWKWSSFRCVLEHFHFDTFSTSHDRLGDPLFEFTLDAHGEVAGFHVLGVEFKKQPAQK